MRIIEVRDEDHCCTSVATGMPAMESAASRSGGCAQFEQAQRFSRREVLRLGGLCGIGLTLPQWLAARSFASSAGQLPTFGRAKRVIMLYLHGGHPQQETFDPKPDGPSGVRGELAAISTSVTGVRFSEVLPRTASIAHKLAVVRSLSHDNPNHVQAALPANTGHKHPPNKIQAGDFPPSPSDFPPFGAVLDAVRPEIGGLPKWVRVGPLMRRNNGTPLHGQSPGFLGDKHAPFVVDQHLLKKRVKIESISPIDGVTSIRLSARRDLLAQFDTQRQVIDRSADAVALSDYYDRAFDLLCSAKTRQAFDLAGESPAIRTRYGLTEFGQRCLLARRLAEAGVPIINVNYCETPSGSWDTHSQNFRSMKKSRGPTFDAAFSALIKDLDQRGLLQETLVIVTAEFGRTPRINKSAGRDHWPWVYSVALAGAGIAEGTVYGASDSAAAYPVERPHDPADLAATLYHLMGIGPDTTLHDTTGRPHSLIVGKPIAGIVA
jgi:hypothetical protein